ncbi:MULTISPECIES: hypothetical protein [unclassified Pseudomonas]|uniref:hypothetical protein n=1 Tax=Pseudomonas TaxID=286 RepID=UPI0008712771|nr:MULTISPECIES: hypothetical protein [unclassified Pseudomonas]SCW35883.1 hypothetical protein SAMN03159481_00568 [Pseudomonas sp. NFACC56-3]SFK16537.1 hypothetical protein SAMN03159473_00567 [Pseudomonas sp. NFACC52]
MHLAEFIDWISRLAIAAYFLWATVFNAQTWNFQLLEFKRVGIERGASLLITIGLAMLSVGSLLLLIPSTVVIGACVLIVFVLSADTIFHRYWTYTDPQEQVIHKIFLFEHVALVGGLLAIISARL